MKRLIIALYLSFLSILGFGQAGELHVGSLGINQASISSGYLLDVNGNIYSRGSVTAADTLKIGGARLYNVTGTTFESKGAISTLGGLYVFDAARTTAVGITRIGTTSVINANATDLTLENVGIFKVKTFVSPSSYDRLTINNNGTILAPSIAQQDTAKKIIGYNVGTGELKAMAYIHGVCSADSLVSGGNNYLSIGGTKNIYYKVNTGGAMTSREADGVLIQGDSIKILTAGDYKVHVWLALSTSNANDKIRVKLFTNNLKNATSLGRFTINSNGSGNMETEYFMWYKEFAVNDWISVRAANISGAREYQVSDIKIIVEKMFE